MDKHPHFIEKATAHAHGQFKEEAARAGYSTEAYARMHEHSPGLLGKRARLAMELIGFAHDHKHGESHGSLAERLHPNHTGPSQ